jgi:hypothetical protein
LAAGPETADNTDNVDSLEEKHVIVDFAIMHYGMKKENPLDSIKFYSKRNPNRRCNLLSAKIPANPCAECAQAGRGDVSSLVPDVPMRIRKSHLTPSLRRSHSMSGLASVLLSIDISFLHDLHRLERFLSLIYHCISLPILCCRPLVHSCTLYIINRLISREPVRGHRIIRMNRIIAELSDPNPNSDQINLPFLHWTPIV